MSSRRLLPPSPDHPPLQKKTYIEGVDYLDSYIGRSSPRAAAAGPFAADSAPFASPCRWHVRIGGCSDSVVPFLAGLGGGLFYGRFLLSYRVSGLAGYFALIYKSTWVVVPKLSRRGTHVDAGGGPQACRRRELYLAS